MEVIATYDVIVKHSEFNATMEKFGYRDRWKSNNVTYYLPNMTLWQNNKALNDAKMLATQSKVILQRCMTGEATPGPGISGEQHAWNLLLSMVIYLKCFNLRSSIWHF